MKFGRVLFSLTSMTRHYEQHASIMQQWRRRVTTRALSSTRVQWRSLPPSGFALNRSSCPVYLESLTTFDHIKDNKVNYFYWHNLQVTYKGEVSPVDARNIHLILISDICNTSAMAEISRSDRVELHLIMPIHAQKASHYLLGATVF